MNRKIVWKIRENRGKAGKLFNAEPVNISKEEPMIEYVNYIIAPGFMGTVMPFPMPGQWRIKDKNTFVKRRRIWQ